MAKAYIAERHNPPMASSRGVGSAAGPRGGTGGVPLYTPYLWVWGYLYIPTIYTYGGTYIYMGRVGEGRGRGTYIYLLYMCMCICLYTCYIYVCAYVYIHSIYVYVQRFIYTKVYVIPIARTYIKVWGYVYIGGVGWGNPPGVSAPCLISSACPSIPIAGWYIKVCMWGTIYVYGGMLIYIVYMCMCKGLYIN
jgi:hypothetical protein